MQNNFLKKPVHGFVLGKFLPPTNGHVYLCDFAQNYVENLTILVCSLPSEPIPGKLRYEWMKELYPRCNVVWCNEDLPQVPEDHPDFWNIWRYVIWRYTHSQLMPIDVVFASEPYGKRLADDQGAMFVPVDIGRETVPICATDIRKNAYEHWDKIPSVVKPYFVKRICLFGAESSGKTTLAKQLAAQYETNYVPEYGRVYTEFFGTDVGDKELNLIVKGHLASVAAAKKHANKVLIEDTDPLMTALWSDMLTGKRHEWFDSFKDYADLYVLCDIDIPWVDDGTRYFKDQPTRQKFFNICEKELIDREVNYVIVSGSVQQRMLQVNRAVRKTLYIKTK